VQQNILSSTVNEQLVLLKFKLTAVT